jgi:MFS family permease
MDRRPSPPDASSARPGPLGLPRLYWVLWVGQFINRLGGFVLTFLPLFLTERHHYSDARAGAVLSLFGLGSLFGASLGGWASDHFGRRRTIIALTGLSAVVLALFGVAPAGPFIAAAALAHGVSNGYGPALTAAVSDVVTPADRARAFGYFYWAVNLGFTAAALLGGALSRHGYHWLFLGDALTSLALTVIVYLFVPETRPAAPAVEPDAAPASARHPISDPRLLPFAVAQFLVLVVFLQSFVTLPLQERARGLTVTDVGLVAALNGVVIVVVQPLFLRVTRAQPAWRLLTLASLLVGAAAAIAARASDLRGFVACMAVVSLGEVAFSSAAPTYVAHIAPAHRRGAYQGVYSLCWAGASLLAPLIGPAVRARFGGPLMWHGAAGLCVAAAVVHAVFTRRAEGPTRGAGVSAG